MKNPFLRLSFVMLGLVTIFSVTGCNSASQKKHDYDTTVVRFFLEADSDAAFASATLPVSGVKVAVDSKPVFTELDIVDVQAVKADLGEFLLFKLTPDAARDLYRLTGNNQGKRMLLTVNGKPFGLRMIDGPFNAGSIAIYAEIEESLLPALVKNINGTSAEIQKEIVKQKS